jgi:hypothetical protein
MTTHDPSRHSRQRKSGRVKRCAREAAAMKTLINVTVFTLLGLSPLAAASHGGARLRDVNARRENEQDRIAKDFSNGELTSKQDGSLETREAHIKNLDLHKDDGHLTKSDFEQLKRDENHISRTIRRDKHG